jgi:hypothetical protein
VHERHTVIEAHDLVFDVVGVLGTQLREHRLDQPDVLGDSLGPDLVADDYARDHAALLCGWASPLASLNTRRNKTLPQEGEPGRRLFDDFVAQGRLGVAHDSWVRCTSLKLWQRRISGCRPSAPCSLPWSVI